VKFKSLFCAVACAGVLCASTAFAGEFGTADEARAMITKAAAALKENKSAALVQFIKGEGGFKDRDLYTFCAGADGSFTAHPILMGKNLKDIKDKSGYALGEEMLAVAREGKLKAVSYLWPRPGQTDPIQKVSFVIKVDDQTCAVGYYW
jgi:signal transduction histidine kinase